MNKLTAIRIKYDDGTYSDEIPVSTLAEYILWDDSHNLVDILGNIDMSKGTVQAQLNEKIDDEALAQYLSDEISADVTNWLNTYVTPVGSAVIVNSDLTVEGAAADAKATGDALSELNERIDNIKPGLSDDAKQALLTCLEHLVWKDATGRSLYNNLVAALYTSNLVAIFSPTETIYDDFTLSDIKRYLEVRLYTESGNYEVIDNYSLAGMLNQTRSILTVNYNGIVTTFPVTVKVGRPLTNNDIMSNLGYTGFGITNENVGFSSAVSFSAYVLSPTIKHIRLTHNPESHASSQLADRGDYPYWIIFNRYEDTVYATDSSGAFEFAKNNDRYSATTNRDLTQITKNIPSGTLYSGDRMDYELNNDTMSIYSKEKGLEYSVTYTNSALIGFWDSASLWKPQQNVRVYDEDRFLTINDIASSRGLGGITVDNHGSIVPTSWTTFSVLDFDPSITKIKYYASTTVTTTNANAFFVFRKVSDDEYYVSDGLSGNLFRFIWNSSKNAYDAVADNTIATVTIENADTFFMYQYRTLELNNGRVIMKTCNGGRIIVDNANCIGFWASNVGASKMKWLEVVVQS